MQISDLFNFPSDEMERCRVELLTRPYVKIKNFFTPKLYEMVRPQLERATFKEQLHPTTEGTYSVRDLVTVDWFVGHLKMLLDDEALKAGMARLAGVKSMSHFSGRLYQLTPQSDLYFGWHDDVTEGRKLAISVNLSPELYQGGELQIKDLRSGEIHHVPNTGICDAVLFKIDSDYMHCVSKVQGNKPKIAMTGWYHAADDLPVT
jgi:hypothetical protein